MNYTLAVAEHSTFCLVTIVTVLVTVCVYVCACVRTKLIITIPGFSDRNGEGGGVKLKGV